MMICPNCSSALQENAQFCDACGKRVEQNHIDPFLGRTLLNQYIVEKKLGEGGFGAVYEANQPAFRRKVAIKTLHRHLGMNPNVLKRFHREGMVASQLEHPSAVKMLNLGETDDGYLWIAMEYLHGETLTRRLKTSGSLSPKELCEILGPVCEVLHEAHQKGIIHRDLKPDNIMLITSQGKLLPKVLDFGIAGLLEDAEGPTKTGMVSGTPPYMPPEQWKGLKHTDPKTDIYALGLVAYQALSGKLPFEADTGPDWMMKHVMEPPLPLRDAMADRPLSASMHSAVMKAIEKNKDARYPTMLAMRDALLAAANDAPAPVIKAKPAPSPPQPSPEKSPAIQASPAPPRPPAPVSQPSPHGKTITMAVGLGALLAAVAFVVYLFAWPSSTTQLPVVAQNHPPETAPASSPSLPATTEANTLAVVLPSEPPVAPTKDPCQACPDSCKNGKCAAAKDPEAECKKSGGAWDGKKCQKTKPPSPPNGASAEDLIAEIRAAAASANCPEALSMASAYTKTYGPHPEIQWIKAYCYRDSNPERACQEYAKFIKLAKSDPRVKQARDYIAAQDQGSYPSCVAP